MGRVNHPLCRRKHAKLAAQSREAYKLNNSRYETHGGLDTFSLEALSIQASAATLARNANQVACVRLA